MVQVVEKEAESRKLKWRCRICGEVMYEPYDAEQALAHLLRFHTSLVEALADSVWVEEGED